MQDKDTKSLFHSGVNVDSILKKNIIFLVLSMLPYFFIQVDLFGEFYRRFLHSSVVVRQEVERNVIPILLCGLHYVALSYPFIFYKLYPSLFTIPW